MTLAPGPIARTAAVPPRQARSRLRRWTPWVLRRVLEVVAIGLVAKYLLTPQLAGAGNWLGLLGGVSWWWVAGALVAELASLLAFSLATRVLLPADRQRPRLWMLWRIDLAGIAVSHAVPGGAAAGTALSYRMLQRAGVDAPAAAFTKLGQGAVSVLVLQSLLVSSIAIAIPLHGSSPLYLTACLAGVAVLLTMLVLTVVLLRAEAAIGRAVATVTARLPRMTAATGRNFVRTLAEQVTEVARRPRLFVASAGWSAANWLFDALALWCCITAFGHLLGYDGLLVPFCLANVAAWIPLTPSGLGIVEGVIVPALVGFGTPQAVALLGTTFWRLLNFWLPIPMGALAYLTFARGPQPLAARAPA